MTGPAGPWSTGTSGPWCRRVVCGHASVPRGAGIVDRQSVPTTETRGLRGYDPAQQIKGRKWHLAVDTLGLPLRVVVQAADLQDRDGARQVLDGLPRLRVIWWVAAATRVPSWATGGKSRGTWQLCIGPTRPPPRMASKSCPNAGSWSEPSPGWGRPPPLEHGLRGPRGLL